MGEVAGVGAVELHAHDLPHAILYDLHQDAIVADQQRGRFERSQPIMIADFVEAPVSRLYFQMCVGVWV